ncbi:MAG: hypothetical protein U0K56_00800 [Bacteroidaceae bacterium]|nr:hypothetical protein [Bacteroidaceae bacterium]
MQWIEEPSPFQGQWQKGEDCLPVAWVSVGMLREAFRETPLDSCANVDIPAKEAFFLGKSLYLYAVTRRNGLFVATTWQANPAA